LPITDERDDVGGSSWVILTLSHKDATVSDVDTTCRIDELAERAAQALAASGTKAPSARVTPRPDPRMLRYYTTLGLLDRPLEVRGRTAYYGRRHLLQVVAIKRMQAAGASLADVQRQLAGASTAELEHIADLPVDGAAPVPAARPAPRRQFWREPPVPMGPAAIRLAPGVTLVLDAARPLSPDDLEAVRRAAAPLVDHLSTIIEER
jgi:DNA-binding transcriptional MerR regulator